MRSIPDPVQNLIDAFSRLPGIGPKSASRLAFFLLKSPEALTLELAEALEALKSETSQCQQCFNITLAGEDICEICASSERSDETICVVEEPLDVVAIENTGNFHGLYHVLHGHISPMERIGPDELRIEPLLARVREDGIREIILATNPTLEGDATAIYISRLAQPYGVSVTRLALGLPRGGDLEYADRMTLSEALAGRRLI